MELFGSPLHDEHPDSWIECGSEGGALHTLNIFHSGRAIYVRYCDADMSGEEERKELHVRDVADAMRLWNLVMEGRHRAL
jgi:hypothetical protein